MLRPSPVPVQLVVEYTSSNGNGGGDGFSDISAGGGAAVSSFVQSSEQPFGVTVEGDEGGDVRIVGLTPGGVAMRSGRLCAGCRIIGAGAVSPCTTAAQVADAVRPEPTASGRGGRVLELQISHEPGEQPGPRERPAPRTEGAIDV